MRTSSIFNFHNTFKLLITSGHIDPRAIIEKYKTSNSRKAQDKISLIKQDQISSKWVRTHLGSRLFRLFDFLD